MKRLWRRLREKWQVSLRPNPILKRLGLSEKDRVVILHADDIGVSESSVAAYRELFEAGILSSAATMVPCAWFPEAARVFRSQAADPRFDVGVHLTLNAEWSGCRWAPITTRDPTSGLVDEAGYFFDKTRSTQERATPEALRLELFSQIERARAAGFPLSHLDTHMLCLFHERLLPIYLEIARSFRLPAFAFRHDAAQWRYRDEVEHPVNRLLEEEETTGRALVDHLEVMALDAHEDRLSEAKRRLDRLPPGLSYFLFHPSKDSAETRAMSPDWRSRVADYELLLDERWRAALRESGVTVIGWKALAFVAS